MGITWGEFATTPRVLRLPHTCIGQNKKTLSSKGSNMRGAHSNLVWKTTM